MIKWKDGNLKVVLDNKLRDLFADVENFMVQLFFETAEFGADHMVEHIGLTPSGIVEGKPHRVDTGLMQASVGVSPEIKDRSNGFSISAGWVGFYEKYFLTQEHGGMSDGLRAGDRYISPMHMLTSGKVFMAQRLARALQQYGFSDKGHARKQMGRGRLRYQLPQYLLNRT